MRLLMAWCRVFQLKRWKIYVCFFFFSLCLLFYFNPLGAVSRCPGSGENQEGVPQGGLRVHPSPGHRHHCPQWLPHPPFESARCKCSPHATRLTRHVIFHWRRLGMKSKRAESRPSPALANKLTRRLLTHALTTVLIRFHPHGCVRHIRYRLQPAVAPEAPRGKPKRPGFKWGE